ncbi:MAG: hypothetical protein QOF48_597 [Verrucomicrobiota bacterium]|jgi:hypothetical protein
MGGPAKAGTPSGSGTPSLRRQARPFKPTNNFGMHGLR